MLAFCLREALESSTSPAALSSFDFLIRAGPKVDKAGICSQPDISQYELPPRDLAQASIDSKLEDDNSFILGRFADAILWEVFFRTVHIFYPIIEPKSFRSRWEEVYDQTSSEREVSTFLCLYLIVAIGALYGNTGSGSTTSADEISYKLFQQAWELQHESLANPSIET